MLTITKVTINQKRVCIYYSDDDVTEFVLETKDDETALENEISLLTNAEVVSCFVDNTNGYFKLEYKPGVSSQLTNCNAKFLEFYYVPNNGL